MSYLVAIQLSRWRSGTDWNWQRPGALCQTDFDLISILVKSTNIVVGDPKGKYHDNYNANDPANCSIIIYLS